MKLQIGKIIKNERKKQGLTLSDVSEATGLSVSYLSLMERGMNSPTIDSVNTICKALGMTMADLFNDIENEPPVVVKEAERKIIVDNTSYLYEGGAEGDQLCLIVMTVRDDKPHSTDGHLAEEIGYVVSGSMNMKLEDTIYELKPGDSICIAAETKHTYRKTSKEDCVSIWVYDAPERDNLSK